MRNKLHNCKNCMWKDNCPDRQVKDIDCDVFTTTNEGSYRAQEYNQALQERSDDYMELIKEMCDELYDS